MNKLRKWLTLKGWSQKQLATAINRNDSTVTRLLDGSTTDPAVSIAVAVESVTGGYVKCKDWVKK